MTKLEEVEQYIAMLDAEVEQELENRRIGKLGLLVRDGETQLKKDISDDLKKILEVE